MTKRSTPKLRYSLRQTSLFPPRTTAGLRDLRYGCAVYYYIGHLETMSLFLLPSWKILPSCSLSTSSEPKVFTVSSGCHLKWRTRRSLVSMGLLTLVMMYKTVLLRWKVHWTWLERWLANFLLREIQDQMAEPILYSTRSQLKAQEQVYATHQ